MPQLLEGYDIDPRQVKLIIDGEEIFVLIDTAIPCGLIMCELMSNTLKYAFPNQQSGEIHVSVCRHNEEIELNFSDNGVGMPQGFDFQTNNSIGLQILVALVEQQLKGHLIYNFQKGIAYKIRFQDNLYTPRVP